MKKYGILAALLAVVVAGIACWQLFKGRDDSMASSIPADATMVGRLDLKTLVMDYGLDLADLKQMLSEDRETGIKYQTAAYVFASKGQLGVIVALSDEDEFQALLEKQGGTIEEQRGMKWSVINGKVLVAFNDDRAMFMGPAMGSELEGLRNTIYACMKQKASESGKQERLYKLLDKRKEPVAMVANMESLPADMLKSYTEYLNIPFEQVDLTAGFTAKKERLTLRLGFQSDDAETDRLLDKFDDLLDEIDGDLTRTLPANALFSIVMGVDGEDLVEHLRENKVLRTALLAANMVLDLDMILKSIDGDVALSVFDKDNATPSVLFQAKLDNDKFMKKVGEWNDATSRSMGFSFYAQDNNQAVCMYKGKPVYFGTNDKRLLISDNETLVKATAHTDAKWNLTSEMKGKRIFATLDIAQLFPLVGKDGLTRFFPMLQLFERLNLSLSSAQDIQLELVAPEGSDLFKELTKE